VQAQLIMSVLIIVAVCVLCLTIVLCAVFRKRLQQAAASRFGWIPKPTRNQHDFMALPDIDNDQGSHTTDGTSLALPVRQYPPTIRQAVTLEMTAEDANVAMHQLDRLANELRRPTASNIVTIVDHAKDS
jgi:hypothetical protein